MKARDLLLDPSFTWNTVAFAFSTSLVGAPDLHRRELEAGEGNSEWNFFIFAFLLALWRVMCLTLMTRGSWLSGQPRELSQLCAWMSSSTSNCWPLHPPGRLVRRMVSKSTKVLWRFFPCGKTSPQADDTPCPVDGYDFSACIRHGGGPQGTHSNPSSCCSEAPLSSQVAVLLTIQLLRFTIKHNTQ